MWILSPRLLCRMLRKSHHPHVHAVRAHVFVLEGGVCAMFRSGCNATVSPSTPAPLLGNKLTR